MLFTTIFLVFAAASPAFSAPVPSTALARVSRGQHAESVKRDAPERRQDIGTLLTWGTSPDEGIAVSPGAPGGQGGGVGR